MMEAASAAAANTAAEEGEIVTHDDILEPLEQLSKLRDEVAELVKTAKVGDFPVNCDIEHNIREIRAILKMNAEIFERCMEFMTHTWADSEDFPSGWATTFNRITYEVVTTRARNKGTQVITHPIRAAKKFDTAPLSQLPQGLDNMIMSDMMGEKFSSYIDFEAFFKKSFILHETVLEQFLPKLKEHLMSIQVCLGEIDAWVIQEPQKNISFLEETFNTKMEMPDDNVTLEPHRCSCKNHDPNEICLNCDKMYCNHYSSENRCNYDRRDYGNTYFQCEYYQLLKQCDGKGKFETTFDITNEKERTKLTKFLEFMAI